MPFPHLQNPRNPEQTALDGLPGQSPRRGSVYISYAWGEDDDYINRLSEAVKTAGFDFRRDSMNVQYAGLISKFMDDLAEGDCVIVVMSDKYIKSPFCMYELLTIYHRHVTRSPLQAAG